MKESTKKTLKIDPAQQNDQRTKYQGYADINKRDIGTLLRQGGPKSTTNLQADIDTFLEKALNKEECQLQFPAGLDPSLLSLLLNNLSLWLGNMDQVRRQT